MDKPISGEEIERMSFAVIDREDVREKLPELEWKVARRIVHACGDPSVVRALRFAPGWLEAARAVLGAGEPIFCDASMARAGLSKARFQRATGRLPEIHCEIANPEVAAQAAASGLPRSVWGVRKAADAMGSGGIWLFGNAPTALMELMRMHLEEDFRPSLVIAMPVGFVHVVESKQEFLDTGLPGIAVAGRRGGTPLAVATLHALLGLLEAAA